MKEVFKLPTQLKNTYVSSSGQISNSVFPQSTLFAIFPFPETVTNGTWVGQYLASCMCNYALTNVTGATAVGNKVSYSYYLQAGTYTIQFFGKSGASSGIIDVSLNGSVILNDWDQYAGSGVSMTTTISNVVISTTGSHTFDIEVVGKNASSSAYTVYFCPMIFTRTA